LRILAGGDWDWMRNVCDMQVALPLLGIMSTGEVAINYLNSTNYMFLGGEPVSTKDIFLGC